MVIPKKSQKTREHNLAQSKAGRNCLELLQMARAHRKRGQKEQSEKFYAALVQVLRPGNAVAELKI